MAYIIYQAAAIPRRTGLNHIYGPRNSLSQFLMRYPPSQRHFPKCRQQTHPSDLFNKSFGDSGLVPCCKNSRRRFLNNIFRSAQSGSAMQTDKEKFAVVYENRKPVAAGEATKLHEHRALAGRQEEFIPRTWTRSVQHQSHGLSRSKQKNWLKKRHRRARGYKQITSTMTTARRTLPISCSRMSQITINSSRGFTLWNESLLWNYGIF